MTQLETLRKLETTLERFLDKAVDLESEQVNMFNSINALDEIARDSLRGRFINNRLGNWFARNRAPLDNEQLEKGAISAIGNLLSEVRDGLDSSDPETQKLIEEIDYWRSKGAVPHRKLILKGSSENAEPDIAIKFAELLSQEIKQLEYYQGRNQHLLSILDDILKSANVKNDPMFMHLAGSIIYFLKTNGYRIDPYVKRLKELEKLKLEPGNDK